MAGTLNFSNRNDFCQLLFTLHLECLFGRNTGSYKGEERGFALHLLFTKYTFTDFGCICCIDDITKENRRDHTYRCVGCGKEMIANLGTKKISYFSHKETGVCSGESYIHRLAKLKFKEKFDNSVPFKISYVTYLSCDNEDCKFKRDACVGNTKRKIVDLKTIYDVCELEKEVSINGKTFIGDIVLTNSQKPNRTPFLIEIFNTHESVEEKKHSGLKILELKIQDESTLEKILINDIITVDNESVVTYGFNLHFTKRYDRKIPRVYYIKGQDLSYKMIPCSQQSQILFEESDLEINVPNNGYNDNSQGVSVEFIGKIASYFSIKRCGLCKFYYQYKVDGHFYDGCCDRFHGILIDEKLPEDIDTCFKRQSDSCVFHNAMIRDLDIVKNKLPKKPGYVVAIGASKEFYNDKFLIDSCKRLLKNKLENDNVKLLIGVFSLSGGANGAYSSLSLSKELSIPIEIMQADWRSLGQKAGPILTEQIIDASDALIYFWNGNESDPRYLVKKAKEKGVPFRIINYGKEEKLCPICGANMLYRRSKGGYFKGCERYPDCNGKRKSERLLT